MVSNKSSLALEQKHSSLSPEAADIRFKILRSLISTNASGVSERAKTLFCFDRLLKNFVYFKICLISSDKFVSYICQMVSCTQRSMLNDHSNIDL